MSCSSRNLIRAFIPGLLLLTAGLGTSALAASIEVTCLSADGSPLRNVQVTLQALPANITETKKSGRDGSVNFKVDGGVYRVWGRLEGYNPSYHEFIDLAPEGAAQVELTFESGDINAQLPFEDPTAAQRSNELLVEGIQAAQKQDYETALEKVSAALELNPSNVDGVYNRAILYLQAKELEKAEQALEESRDLLRVFVKIYADNPTAAEQLQQRLEGVEQLLESMPVQRLGAEADSALAAKDYETAIAKYRQMSELEPGNAIIHYNLALALTHGNKLDEAKQSIARALELKPDDVGFKRLQAQIQDIEKQGISLRASEAIKETQELIEKKEYQAALDKINSVLGDVPEELQSGSYLLIARAQAGLGNVEEAIASYRKSSELDEARQQAEPEAAEGAEGEAAEEEDPAEEKKAGIDRELANFLFQQERYAEGIETYLQALRKENAGITFEMNQLGQTFSRQGKNDAAALVYEKLSEIDPDYSEAYYQLGMYHFYDTEQRDKAKQLLEKFVSMGGAESHIDNAKAVLAVMASKKQ